MILFLLTACGSATPQVTVTSEVTITLTPTATLTVTPTPTVQPFPPEFTKLGLDAANYQINGDKITSKDGTTTVMVKNEKGEWVAYVTLPTEIVDSVTAQLGEGFTVSGDKITQNDVEIPDLTIVPAEDGKTYTFLGVPYDFEANGVKYTMPFGETYKPEDITINAKGQLCIPARCLENGVWVREVIKYDEAWERTRLADATRGLEAEIPKYTREEFMAAVLSENAWLKATDQMGDDSAARLSDNTIDLQKKNWKKWRSWAGQNGGNVTS